MEEIQLINFIDLTEKQHHDILSYRNHQSVRTWMYNNDVIPIDKHIEFIEKLKHDNSNKYFLVKKDKINIGVIYFNCINYTNNTVSFGLYANQFDKIKGAGKILQERCIDYAFNVLKIDTLKLEVFSSNNKARILYKKYNFIETRQKNINEKNIICMELKRI